uniref:Ig-like domain-containing protein n=1 Tax=Terrapene triunguis TaxID=2587831 RepID=A0A674JF41_9SAUR
MGRALPPQHNAGEWDLPAQGPPSSPATFRFHPSLSPAGSLSQQPEFTLMVPQSVSVQEGLCVLVPCTFTYPASYDTYGSWARLFRYWYKDTAFVGQNPPVASSNPSQRVSQQTKGRFRLAENPVRGDCSLQISDAQRTDAGRYFLRVEGDFSYNYRTRTDGTDLTLTISVPGTLLAGEPVTVTCTAPGRCSGTPPQITWTRPFSNTAQDVSTRLAKGTSAHSSVLRFTPTPGDDGKELVCTVTYRPRWEPSTRRTVQLRVVLVPWVSISHGSAEGDIVSLVTQEGDSLTLRCEAGSRTEVTLSWARVNGSLSPSQGGAGYLELLNLSPGDVGDYRCWAKNSYGWASRALRVHVQSPVRTLQITVSRANRNPGTLVANGSQLIAQEGDSLRFLCSLASSPPAVLGWVRGGQAVEGARPPGENHLRLELPNVTAEDGGLYRCWAQNEERLPDTGFLSLTINLSLSPLLSPDSPRPGTGLNSSCQRQGPSVNCSCSLRSHPAPRLQWQVDGEPLAGNCSRGALQVSSWAQGDEAVSTLSWTGSGDRGPRIFCLGSNPHGSYAPLHFDFSPLQRGETLGLPSSVPSSEMGMGMGREPGFLGSLPSPGRRVGSGSWRQGSWEPGLLGSFPAMLRAVFFCRCGGAWQAAGRGGGLWAGGRCWLLPSRALCDQVSLMPPTLTPSCPPKIPLRSPALSPALFQPPHPPPSKNLPPTPLPGLSQSPAL